MDYISTVLTEDQFYDKIYAKSKSWTSVDNAKTAIISAKYYAKDVYKKELDAVLADLKKDLAKTGDLAKILRFLDEYCRWCEKDHPNVIVTNVKTGQKKTVKAKKASSIKTYLQILKKYLRLVGGIKVDSEDIRDYVTIPEVDENTEDEEAEPFLKEELKLVIETEQDPQRKTKLYVIKDTGFRHAETMQLQKKDFDFTKEPPTVYLAKQKAKGKKRSRTRYLTTETAHRVRLLLKGFSDEDYVFKKIQDQHLKAALSNETQAFRRVCDTLGYTERYAHNNRRKKNIHSIRAFCNTQFSIANNNRDLGHAYIGHSQYLGQYDRYSEKQKAEFFKRAEPHLSLYSDIVVVENTDERIKEIEKKIEQFQKMHMQDSQMILDLMRTIQDLRNKS